MAWVRLLTESPRRCAETRRKRGDGRSRGDETRQCLSRETVAAYAQELEGGKSAERAALGNRELLFGSGKGAKWVKGVRRHQLPVRR